LSEAFRYAAWGESSHKRELDRLREEANQRSPELAYDIEKRIRRGNHAHQLGMKLLEKLHQTGLTDELKDWMRIQINQDPLIARHLKITVEKWDSRAKAFKARTIANKKDKKAGLPPVFAPLVVKEGGHPNSIPNLPPSSGWRVIIDESGTHFDAQSVEDDMATEPQVGLLTALVIPDGVKLPQIDPGFHAVDKTSRQVDEVVAHILKAKVGVFGFSVNDPAARAGNWIGHVESLVRWVLIQLPVKEDSLLRVDCRIEQRGKHESGQNLDVVAEILEGEFKKLDPQRFGGLKLRLALTTKDEPQNGYADAIAFTWGSPSKESRQRLKATAWAGHCLLKPDKGAFERLLLALSHQAQLSPPQWYMLSEAATGTPNGGVIARMLDRLGASVQQQPPLWESFLDELRQKLRIKQFSLKTIAWALGWLERWKPAQNKFPPRMQLMLETANLATENHQGKINPARIQQSLSLSNRLLNEAPDEACEAVLRVAVATTNNFEFDLLRPEIERWLQQPVGIAGLLNYGKLQSTLGQILAFTDQAKESLECFAAAISSFSRLSESGQALREVEQTTTYQLIAQMDAPDVDVQKLQDNLQLFLQTITRKNSLLQISQAMGSAGDGWRFPHHLWVRALVQFPEDLQKERAAYLGKEADWQSGDTHPWPLIQAYRGWMLQDEGKTENAAAYFDEAVALCRGEDYGLTLRWMAEVLCVTAQKLGVSIDSQPNAMERSELKRLLPQAPHAHLSAFVATESCTGAQIIRYLQLCLPFNFH
jgi:tetratricopeptide (TPR) repeat protein